MKTRLRLYREWSRLDLALLAAALLTILAGLLAAQLPPLPPGAALPPLTIAWDRNPAADYFKAVDTNGNPVALVYRVRMAPAVTNALPWPVVATTTNTTAILSNLPPATAFFYVTASNFFLESEPSDFISLPFEPGSNLRLVAP